MPREISAGAVVYRRVKDEPQFLLLHYSLGHWDFPKGNIEEGEEEKETVRREIAEETGITRITFVEGFRETVRYYYKWKGQGIFKIVLVYLVETPEESVKISDEHIGYEWLPYEGAMKRLTHKNSRQVLEKAMKVLSEKKLKP